MGVLNIALLTSLYFQCGSGVNPETLNAIVITESGGNPYVVANVTNKTSHAFNSKQEAIHYVNSLEEKGEEYSAGLMQIYSGNFQHYGLNNDNVFNNCANINAGSKILKQCFVDSKKNGDFSESDHLKRAFSCYYSGNFERGFSEKDNYVERVISNYVSIYSVPTLAFYSNKKVDDKNEGLEILDAPIKAQAPQKIEVVKTEGAWDVFSDFKK